jgi:hypothetical protein
MDKLKMNISEEQLTTWSKAPSETEEGKSQNAVSLITEVIRDKFGSNVTIFLQGSYKNRTNIKIDSDVDIVVRHDGYFFPAVIDLSESDKSAYWSNFKASSYSFPQFKGEILDTLIAKFGTYNVTRHEKCINVAGNSYRVNADIVPCFIHRRLRTPTAVAAEGIEFITDSGPHVSSFPVQHYNNGVSKHGNTDQKFKAIVRILKHVRNQLIDQGKLTNDAMPSFFLECLVWNVLPDTHFKKDRYLDASRAVIATLWNEMREAEKANNYAEVSDLKWLFKGNSQRTHQEVSNFMQAAWDFIGYND